MTYIEKVKNQIDVDGIWTDQRGDASFSAAVTIDPAHHEIHEGDHYTWSDTTDLGNGATIDLLFITPDTTKRIHLVWFVATEAEATIIAYEDTITSANGSQQATFNNRRDSGNTATMTVYTGPTVSAVGTQLIKMKTGSGRGIGGERRGDNEWILDQNSKYMLRITNDTATNNWIDWTFSWYEHTDDV